MNLVAVTFIFLHAPGGAGIIINPHEITSMRQRPSAGDQFFVGNAECMINLTDGKFVAVIEACETVHQMIEEATK